MDIAKLRDELDKIKEEYRVTKNNFENNLLYPFNDLSFVALAKNYWLL